MVVTEDRDAFLNGAVNLRDMLDNVARPLRIRIVCDAVFGDENRFPESFPYMADRTLEPLWIDLPTHLGHIDTR
jgi:hypothetical protein